MKKFIEVINHSGKLLSGISTLKNNQLVETLSRNPSGWTLCDNSNKGFTLIELLVVLLIIGVLTAVALPKYQVAVQKSRYAGLMPLAKSVKTAEEAVYMANGSYTETLTDLFVTVPNETDVTITPKSDDNESYVRAEKTGLDNRLVMYFARSPRYANEIHCEAIQENDRAKQICLSLGASTTTVDGTADSSGYDTYVLEGTGVTAGSLSGGGGDWSWDINNVDHWVVQEEKVHGEVVSSYKLGYDSQDNIVAFRGDDEDDAGYDVVYDSDGNPVFMAVCGNVNSEDYCTNYSYIYAVLEDGHWHPCMEGSGISCTRWDDEPVRGKRGEGYPDCYASEEGANISCGGYENRYYL